MGKIVKIKLPLYAMRATDTPPGFDGFFRWGDGTLVKSFSKRELEIILDDAIKHYGATPGAREIVPLETLELEGELLEEGSNE